jgi:hypothetical protein
LPSISQRLPQQNICYLSLPYISQRLPQQNICYQSLPWSAQLSGPQLQSRGPNSHNCSITSSEQRNLLQLLFIYTLLVSEPDAGTRRDFCWIKSWVDFLLPQGNVQQLRLPSHISHFHLYSLFSFISFLMLTPMSPRMRISL